ncbi:5'-nucleotidase C-terminal domain-containing protein [Paenibacillus fonticola]|uniref:5'-nucleotidase C-terminal domain-containing protein n=1 Tax=Paenibacillus fonticola TaxID=379896 RepID=UPI000374573F|nr:5'-nucleotidase C-terminal domain-containing protein [Paenibacillus fonticola]
MLGKKGYKSLALLLIVPLMTACLFSGTALMAEQPEYTGAQKASVSTDVSSFGIAEQLLPKATAGTAYSVTIDVYGGQLPYTFAALELPEGLYIEPASGTISGIPGEASAGVVPITIQVTDSSSPALVAEAVLELEVQPPSPHAEETSGNWKLTVMHTNDTHAHLADVAKRTTLVRQIREEAAGNSLLLDAGDVFSGDLYFTKWQGMADLAFMNLMKYDAMTFGNHEFDKGTAVLADFVRQAHFPLVSSNIDFSQDQHMSPLLKLPKTIDASAPKSTLDAGVYPYIVLDVNGRRVGVMGLTTEDTKETSSPGKDVVFRQAAEAATEAVNAMEAEGLDIIIALSHLGYARDKELARQVEGIDLIVGGHTHTKLDEPEIVKNGTNSAPTVIVQSNEWGKYLGRVDLYFDNQGVVLTGEGLTSGQLIAVDSMIAEDSMAQAMLAPFNEELDVLKKQVIGVAKVVLDGERGHARSRETNLGNLIADGMLSKAKQLKDADIALMNGGGIRASIDEGDITMGELRTVMPFGNTLFVLDVTGKQLREGLENGISGAKLADLPGKFPQVAGMKFKWDPDGPANSKVYDIQIKKEDVYVPLSETATYRLATNSFVANGGDGYASFAEAIANGAYNEDLGYPDYEIFMEYVDLLGGKVSPIVEGRIIELAKPNGNGGGDSGTGGGGNTPDSSSGSSSGSTPAGPQTSPGNPAAKPENTPQANPEAGAQAYELSGKQLQIVKELQADGTELTRITASAKHIQTALAAAKRSVRRELVVRANELNGAVKVSLPAEVLALASGKDDKIILVIQTARASYGLPLHVLGLGPSGQGNSMSDPIDFSRAMVNISLIPLTGKALEKMEYEAQALGAALVANTAMDFNVSISVDEEERGLHQFGLTYVSRMIYLPKPVNSRVLTAVHFNEANGELSFVPAVLVNSDRGPALEMKRPGNSIYAVLEYTKNYADVKGHWAEPYIGPLASKFIVKGVDEENYGPGAAMTKAEFTKALVRSLGMAPVHSDSKFTDIGPNTSFAGEIGAAAKYGLVSGDEMGRFLPNAELTRAEMAVMTAHAVRFVTRNEAGTAAGMTAGITAMETPLSTASSLAVFKDKEAIPAWAESSVALLANRGILKGDDDGKFNSSSTVTRAQAAVILLKMLQQLKFID